MKMFNKWSVSWYPKGYTFLRLYPDGSWSIWVDNKVVAADCTIKGLEQYLKAAIFFNREKGTIVRPLTEGSKKGNKKPLRNTNLHPIVPPPPPKIKTGKK